GKIYTNVFSFPDGQTLPTSNTPEVWQWERTTPNIYFPSANVQSDGRIAARGNVGVGTTSPNYMLELSNRSSLTAPLGLFISPVLTYDFDNSDIFSVGVLRTDPDVLRFFPGGESSIASVPPLSIYNRFLGVRTARPRAALDSAGRAIISGSIRIGGYETSPTHAVGARLSGVGALAIRGSLYGWPSIKRGDRTDIYWTTDIGGSSSFVGIGQTLPQYELDVAGTINVTAGEGGNSFIITDRFIFERGLTETSHFLYDPVALDYVRLYVAGRELVMDDSLGQTINISKVLTGGSGAKGNLSIWAEGASNTLTILGEVPMLWIGPIGSDAGKVSMNAPIGMGSKIALSTYTVSHNWDVMPQDGSVGMAINSHGTYDGDLTRSGTFDSYVIKGIIDGWPDGPSNWSDGVGPIDRPYLIKGYDIALRNSKTRGQQTLFTKNGTAYGLAIDVSNVSVQEFGDRGYRFPAIFNAGVGSGVGIGITPSVELDVRGTVVANFFKISNGLIISTINVLNGGFSVVTPHRVAIGVNTPSVELEIGGAVESKGVNATQGLSAFYMNTKSSGLVIKETGLVGVGNTSPVALFDLKRQFDSPIDASYSFYNIDVVATNNTTVLVPVTGYSFTLNAINTGSTTFGNRLGTDTKAVSGLGLNVDLTGMQLTSTGSVVGLDVSVSNERSSRNVAVFLGGNVGIGTANPSIPLEVKGTIFGTNAPQASFLQEIKAASFNRLNIANGMVIPNDVNAGSMVVENDIRLQSFVAINSLELSTNTLNITGETLLNNVTANVLVKTVDMASAI
ncbi:hypothetical protein EBR57_01530, partial [bacterium]|nr:hypothetical protein [bacterium]